MRHRWASFYFYPRSPCGERQRRHKKHLISQAISIHALLAESDASQLKPPVKSHNFYPRSPCGERHTNLRRHRGNDNFYPRSPCGERQWTPLNSPVLCYFYPRSPCGERRCLRCCAISCITISIHALLAESDDNKPTQRAEYRQFLSTLSLRRATETYRILRAKLSPISIHALLAESDTSWTEKDGPSFCISIHALLAESDIISTILCLLPIKFLSTLSLRRATLRVLDGSKSSIISIHALLAESDWSNQPVTMHTWKFLSTLSLRRATYDTYAKVLRVNISIHALLAESDISYQYVSSDFWDFYPRSPCGERQCCFVILLVVLLFLSTLSLRRATADYIKRNEKVKFLSTLSLRRATTL